MKYNVEITDAAQEDMDEIYDYIRFTFHAPYLFSAIELLQPCTGLVETEPLVSRHKASAVFHV